MANMRGLFTGVLHIFYVLMMEPSTCGGELQIFSQLTKFITTIVLLLNVTLQACKASELKKVPDIRENRKSGKKV